MSRTTRVDPTSERPAGLDARQLPYVVEVRADTSAYPEQVRPTVAPYKGRGRRLRPPYHKPPSSLTQLAVAAGQQACVDLIWRRGSKGLQRGRFLAVRVRPAGVTPRRRARQDGGELPVRWLLVEWPTGQATPVKYWLSNLPQTSPLVELVGLARSRWRVEAGLPRTQRCARAGPLRGARLGRLAPPRDPGLGRARLPHPGAAATPKTGGVGLTLWQPLSELQVLLGCWAGACPVCKRPAPRRLRRTGRAPAPT